MANVCQTCGDEGFVEALVRCDSCKFSAVHRYCCGIMPVPIDGYVTWFCSDCDESDTASDSVLVEIQDTEVSSSPPIEEPETTREIPGCSKSNGLVGVEASVSEAGDGSSLLLMTEKKKKKKKKKRKIITHSLPDATTIVETMEVSKKQDGSENGESDELIGLAESGKKKKKKKKKTDKGEEKSNQECSNHSSPVLEAEVHGLQATTSVEPMKESKKRKCSESKESEELNVLVGSEGSVLEKSAKKKKKNEESSTHTVPVVDADDHVLQDVPSVEATKESTMPANVLAANEVSVLEKSAKKKKKKKKKKKSNEESSTHTLPFLDAEHQEVTKDSIMPLNVLVGNEASVLEKNAKKKKKKKKHNEESNNHTSPVLKAVDCGHVDTTSVEAMKECKKHKKSDETTGEKSEKKKKKTNEESSNNTAPDLAAKDNVAYDTDNVEPAKAQESSASRKPDELAGLEENEASVSEGGNSTNVPDHNSCTTSKKTSISSRKIQVTSEIMKLAANNSSCKEAESNMPVMLALNNDRAQPICAPVWRGSVTVTQGNNFRIHGLVAHLSTLACQKVHEKVGSLRTRLSAQMFPRLEIWPPSFLNNGPPSDENIALYFFPSPDSNGEEVYYSLVDEMKKKDLAMRCLLDGVELLLFTSYQLPLPCWKFRSKEYLWGIFRRRKNSRH